MLYLIGLGLSDPQDVTVRGLELIRSCSRVFLDAYTSVLSVGKEGLEEFYGRPVELADRDAVEQGERILDAAAESDVAFLVVGDPLGATTHTDLALRARLRGISYRLIHNASILTAVAACGLQLYTFGETVSVPFWDAVSRPGSFLDKLLANRQRGLHTLCLLDIRVREPTLESLLRGRPQYEPPRFMTCAVAAQQILALVEEMAAAQAAAEPGAGDSDRRAALSPPESCLVVGLARLGNPTEQIVACSLAAMSQRDLGPPLHSLVVPAARLHPVEAEFLAQFADSPEAVALVTAAANAK